MQRSEQVRIVICGTCLLLAALAVFSRLAWLQITTASSSRAEVDRLIHTSERLPAARGVLMDRRGRPVGHDRPVHEVRAEWSLVLDEPGRLTQGMPAPVIDSLTSLLASALAMDPLNEDPGYAGSMRTLLRSRIEQSTPRPDQQIRAPTADRGGLWRRRGFFLVHPAVDSADVLDRLRSLSNNDRLTAPLRLHLTFEQKFLRTYPYGDLTAGPIGQIGRMQLGDQEVTVQRGLERLKLLSPGSPGARVLRRTAGGSKRFSTGNVIHPDNATVVHTTLDVDLQKAANEELDLAVQGVAKDFGSPPEWGAMILVEVATGDILAMASYARDGEPRGSAFAPVQKLYEPGSVVKPLLFAVALEARRLDWTQDRIDCTPNHSRLGWKLPNCYRVIYDVVRSGVLTPHEILMRSSNIGATLVGRRLAREDLQTYVERFQFGRSTHIGLPEELAGSCRLDFMTMQANDVLNWAGPSVSFGYEMHVTPLQIMRSYLTLLSWRPRELRLCTGSEVRGEIEQWDVRDRGTVPFPHRENLELLRAAMLDVVSDQPGATGKPLHEYLVSQGFAHGLMAGKSGTSKMDQRRMGPDGTSRVLRMHTASFIGFAPVAEPRYLAMCVMQRESASSLHGGKYASVPAGRMLLRALFPHGPAGLSGPVRVSEANPQARESVPAGSRSGRS